MNNFRVNNGAGAFAQLLIGGITLNTSIGLIGIGYAQVNSISIGLGFILIGNSPLLFVKYISNKDHSPSKFFSLVGISSVIITVFSVIFSNTLSNVVGNYAIFYSFIGILILLSLNFGLLLSYIPLESLITWEYKDDKLILSISHKSIRTIDSVNYEINKSDRIMIPIQKKSFPLKYSNIMMNILLNSGDKVIKINFASKYDIGVDLLVIMNEIFDGMDTPPLIEDINIFRNNINLFSKFILEHYYDYSPNLHFQSDIADSKSKSFLLSMGKIFLQSTFLILVIILTSIILIFGIYINLFSEIKILRLLVIPLILALIMWLGLIPSIFSKNIIPTFATLFGKIVIINEEISSSLISRIYKWEYELLKFGRNYDLAIGKNAKTVIVRIPLLKNTREIALPIWER